METEIRKIHKQMKKLASEDYQIPHCELVSKSSELFNETKIEANNLFTKPSHTTKQHQILLDLYSKGVALAPFNSDDLGVAYSNRSAMLFHIRRYNECIMDIDKAVEIIKSDHIKVKLYCRKAQCLSLLELSGNEKAIKKAMESYRKIDDLDDKKHTLAKLISKTRDNMDTKDPADKLYDDTESREILSGIEKQNVFDSVEIKYSEKDGRHLVAAKDFRPGDVIMAEKPYAVFPDQEFPYLYCTHCLSLALAGIPCNFCNWCLFCSKKCKKTAWEKYHELECAIMPFMIEPEFNGTCLKLAVRILMKMIKEASGIEELKTKLKNIDEDLDSFRRSFSVPKLDDSIKFIYNLSRNVSKGFLNQASKCIVESLLRVIQSIPFFGQLKQLDSMKIEDLTKNEDVSFIGALLLKLTKITSSNQSIVKNYLGFHFKETSMKYLMNPNKLETIEYLLNYQAITTKGTSLHFVGSFINNSCLITNAAKFHVDGSKLVIYAEEPIKKNSQIFVDYFASYNQNNMYPKDRKSNLKKIFGFDCKCQSCKNNILLPKIPFNNIEWHNRNNEESFVLMESGHTTKHFKKVIKHKAKLVKTGFQTFIESGNIYNRDYDSIKAEISSAYILEFGHRDRVFDECGD